VNPPEFDLLVIGEINPDLILSGDVEPAFNQVEKLIADAALTIGSSAVILACGASRLGLKTAVVGVCGDDVFGRFMQAEMAKRGLNTDHLIVLPGAKTGLSVILNRVTDRAILTFPGVMPLLAPEHLPQALLQKTRHLHVASYFLHTGLQPALRDIYAQARRLGVSTSLDTNWDPQERWQGVHDLLAVADVFFPNEAEARSLTGEPSPAAAANRLAQFSGCVALKLGAAGALAQRGRQAARCPGLPVQVVDTVGAGDSFDAGFIYGFLHGWELSQCLQLAVACGALSTRAAGGTQAQPTLDEALNFLKLNGINLYAKLPR